MSWKQAFATFLFALLTLAVAHENVRGDSDDFSCELELLRGQKLVDVDRATLVEAYEKFVTKYHDDSRVADVMLDIFSLFEVTLRREIDSIDLAPDYSAALEWLRKAEMQAPSGGPTWKRAAWLLANRSSSKPDDARTLYRRIAECSVGDRATLAKVERSLAGLEVSVQDLDAAEKHCRKLLSSYDEPNQLPTDVRSKREVDSEMGSCVALTIEAWLSSPMPIKDRIKKIEAFQKDFPFAPEMSRDAKEAIQRLQKQLREAGANPNLATSS